MRDTGRELGNKYPNLFLFPPSDLLSAPSLAKPNKKPETMGAIYMVYTDESPRRESKGLVEFEGQIGDTWHRGEV